MSASKHPYNRNAPLVRLGGCTLYPAVGERAVRSKGKRNSYWGVCETTGLEQMQRFDGYYDVVQRQFAHWVDGIPKMMSIEPVKKQQGTEKEKEMSTGQNATQPSASERVMPDRLYAVAYKRGTAVRYVMAFESDDDALDAAEVSGKALEVAGVDGEYTVDELPVRWRRAQ